MRVLAVIPARYASSRFPGKALAPLAGKPLVQHVYERVRQCKRVNEIVVATDDARIEEAVRGFGGAAIMTDPAHRSGTDRVAEVAAQTEDDLILNIQGDEPLIEPVAVDDVVEMLMGDASADIGTLMAPITSDEELADENVVKVVVDVAGRALYFSRAPIPHRRSDVAYGAKSHRHIGMYGYRREALQQLAQLEPTPLELTEMLEQLRALENGMTIRVVKTMHAPIGVDTPEDLERVAALLEEE